MTNTLIGQEMCPGCGRVTWLVRLPSGRAFLHSAYSSGPCIGLDVFVRAGDAEAVRQIRERGGERLRLAAHP